jgi:hypothetical protein
MSSFFISPIPRVTILQYGYFVNPCPNVRERWVRRTSRQAGVEFSDDMIPGACELARLHMIMRNIASPRSPEKCGFS